MRAQCITAVTQAIGRSLNQAEIAGIEARMRGAMKQAARTNIPAWQAKSMPQRLAEAAQIAAQDLAAEAAKKKARVALTIMAHDRIENAYTSQVAAGVKPFSAVQRILENVSARVKGTANEYFSDLLNTIQAVEPRFFGLIENAKHAGDFVREVFSLGSSGNAAMKKAAETWLKTVEAMRTRFNAAGGDVGKLDYGYLPQLHDAVRILKAGADQWAARILPMLDRTRYLHEDGALLSDTELTDVLKGAWETITTGGLNKLEPGQIHGSSLANRHSDHRAIHFKDAQAYIDYHAEFGKGSVFSAMQSHVGRLARDISLLEELGPNPNVQFSYFYDLAKKAGDVDRRGLTGSMWKVLNGEANHPVDVKFAEVMQGARNIASHAKLGSALLSSLNDIPTYFATLGFNRLGWFAGLRRLLTSAGGDQKKFANRAGLVAESLISDMNRWAEGNLGHGWTGKLANATMKASLLEGWTDAIRRATSTMMMGAFGKLSRLDWAKLEAGDKWRMENHGITETDWNVYRLAKPENWNGSQMLTKDAIRAIADADLQAAGLTNADRNRALSRLLGAIVDEGEHASLGQSLKARAITSGAAQKGTLAGEIWRSVMLFKGFPIAMITRHWGRTADLWAHGEKVSALKYSAGLISMLTMFGALSMEMKDLAAGKDPRDMDPESRHGGKFWAAAFFQGGGAGFAGDIIYQAMGGGQSQGGTSTAANVASSILGPVFGSVGELADVTLGNASRAMQGKQTHTGAEAVKWLRGNLPGAGFLNLWYAKAAVDHAVMNDLMEYLSPGYLSRMQERAAKDWGSHYWWNPREGLPQQGPNIMRAFGG